MELRPVSESSRYVSRKRHARSMAASLTLLAAGMGAVGSVPGSGNVAEHETRTAVAPPQVFEKPEIAIIAIDTHGVKARFDDDELRESFQTASDNLERATDSAISLEDNLTIEHETSLPQGIGERDNDQHCYTREQSDAFVKEYRRTRTLGSNAIVSLVYTSDADCSYYQKFGAAGAYTLMSKDAPYIVYNELGHVEHEMGHAWGLPHAKEIDTMPVSGKGRYMWFDAMTMQDQRYAVTTQFADGTDGTKLSKRELQLRQEYSAQESIMGSAPKENHPLLYTPEELSIIAPDRYHVRDVNGTGEYPLTLGKDGDIAIRMRLPAGHALRNIDDGVDSVVFGLSVTAPTKQDRLDPAFPNDNSRELSLVASIRGKKGTYVFGAVEFPYAYSTLDPEDQATLDNKLYYNAKQFGTRGAFDEKAIYVDHESDTIVTLFRRQDGTPVVKIGDSSTSRQLRDSMRSEYEYRQSVEHETE